MPSVMDAIAGNNGPCEQGRGGTRIRGGGQRTPALVQPTEAEQMQHLVPVSRDIVIPDLRWLIGGGFVVIFLLVGWIRAARRGN
jgi:hypothetical protein